MDGMNTSEGMDPNDGSFYGDIDDDQNSQLSPAQAVSWQASEYVHHAKQAGWYISLAAAIVVVTVGTYLLTRDWLAPLVIAVMGGAVWIYASKQPRTLSYTIGPKGIQVGDKSYPYDQFRSFSIVQEDAMTNVLLSPLKRFMTPLSLYYAPDDEDDIITALSLHLPHDRSQPDAIERLASRLRF